jgi:hypothetical protein
MALYWHLSRITIGYLKEEIRAHVEEGAYLHPEVTMHPDDVVTMVTFDSSNEMIDWLLWWLESY